MVNPQLLEGASDLREVHLVDFAPSLWGGEVVAAPVRVERGKQAIGRNGLAQPVKARCRALLVTKKHAGVLAGGVIHRHHQIPHRVGHPAVRAGVLVNHHARQRHAFALGAVFASARVGLGHYCALQHAFKPAVAARTGKLWLYLL